MGALDFMPVRHPFRRCGVQAVSPRVRMALWCEERLPPPAFLPPPPPPAWSSSADGAAAEVCQPSRYLDIVLSSPESWAASRWWVGGIGHQLRSVRMRSARDDVVSSMPCGLTGLETLDVSWSHALSDAGVRAMFTRVATTPLRCLMMSGLSRVTPQAFSLLHLQGLLLWQSLRHLSLASCPHVDDAVLHTIAQLVLPRLEVLSLASTAVTDDGFTGMDVTSPWTFGSLTELDLSRCAVTYTALPVIERLCSSLRSLTLHRCTRLGAQHDHDQPVEAAAKAPVRGLSVLASLRDLVLLHLSCTLVRDEDLLALANAGRMRLEVLRIGHCCALTEDGLCAVALFPQLRILDLTALSFNAHRGRVVMPLIGRCLPLLEELCVEDCWGLASEVIGPCLIELLSRSDGPPLTANLRGCSGVEGDLALIGAMPVDRHNVQLRSLSLARCGASELGWMLHLGNFLRRSSLTSLSIVECPEVTDNELRHFFEPPSHDEELNPMALVSLDLSDCSVGDASMGRVVQHTKSSLRTLALTDNYRVTDASMTAIGCVVNLECLRIGGTSITDVGLGYLRPLCHSLRRLDLSGCCMVTDVGLLSLELFALLEDVRLDMCMELSDACGEALAALPALTSLSVASCASLGSPFVSLLASSPSELRRLSLRSCPMVTNSACRDLVRLRWLESLDVAGTLISPPRLRWVQSSLYQLHDVTPPLHR